MDAIIETFHIEWKIIIAQAINFAVVFVILYLFALKPLSKLMSERSERIAKGIDDAKANADILTRTETEYNEAIAKAKSEAAKIFQEGKKEADAKRTEMLDKAKDEVASVIESGKKVLEAEKIKMVAEAKKEIVTLTLQATEKLLGAKVDGNFDQRTIEELKNI
jgi:F-type H+-transporting ATPase subunit b